jgi:hypothetical protein
MKRTSPQHKQSYDVPPDAVYADPTQDKFTQIPNTVIEDKNLSWKSLGILIYLLKNKNKEGWHTHTSSVIQAKKDKKDSVASGLKELEMFGYVLRFQYFDEKKKVRGSFFAYTAHPYLFTLKTTTKWLKEKGWGFTPSTKISRQVYEFINKKLKPEKPKPEKPKPGNPPLIINNINKEIINKKLPFSPLDELKNLLPHEMKKAKIVKSIKAFIIHRKEINKPIKTLYHLKNIIKQLSKFPEQEIVRCLEECIHKNWTGFFPKKEGDLPVKQSQGFRPKQEQDDCNGLDPHWGGDQIIE